MGEIFLCKSEIARPRRYLQKLEHNLCEKKLQASAVIPIFFVQNVIGRHSFTALFLSF